VEEEGMATYVIGFSQDITDRIKTEKALLEAKEQVEMTSKAKEIFLANMSHEIRTPMNGSLGLGNLLNKTKLTLKQKEFTRLIIESGNNLMYIVNDILDYTKIQSSQFKLETIPFDLADKVNSTIQTFHFKAEEKSIALNFNNKLTENLMVEGDPHRLGQVLNNLLSNAFKFTAAGSISVELNQISHEEVNPTFEIRVTDTGMGISKENQASIFEQFVQATPDITRKFGGTGLGLSICKTLLELQGGSINVESELNKGTTFIVRINYKKVKEIAPSREQQKHGKTLSSMKKKILVAEDVQINQLIVKHILKGWGHSVTIVENGKEVLKLLEKNQFDLILMDIHMPEMNGVDTTRLIRKLTNPKKANIPIIAVSAAAFKDEIKGYLDSGMNDFVTKPYTEEKLLEVFNRVLRISQPSEEESILESTKTLGKMEKLYDLTRLNEFGDDDPGFIKEIIVVFLSNTGKDLDDLMQAVKDENYQVIFEIAHRMKSSLHTMGIKSLETTIKDLESLARHNDSFDKIKQLSTLVKKTLDLVFEQLKTDFKQD
jgi:CheY-like chemotaxis protein/HPt (histidine-containing phosphotransfer) domain-containing protein